MSESTGARIHIRPRRIGDQVLSIRKPVGGYLAEAGEEVNDSTYWQRRLLDGDVELVPAKRLSGRSDAAEHRIG